LPAIEEARSAVAEMIQRHAAMAAKLRPGQVIVSFNPHASGPGATDLPASANTFRFWSIQDEDTFSTFMEQLAIQLDMLELPDAEFARLPQGYGVARYVLRFETHCKFDSWLAVQNVGEEEMRLVRHYYQIVGMSSEAAALEKAEAAWYAAGGHEGNGYDAARDAYRSVSNQFQDEDERWFELLRRLRSEELWSRP
jgi:hypothetical protein